MTTRDYERLGNAALANGLALLARRYFRTADALSRRTGAADHPRAEG